VKLNTGEVIKLAEHEQQSILKMGEAVSQLPEDKKQFFLGYAEGVAAMAEQLKPEPAPECAS
jgi:hypothetical protein